MKIPKKVIIAGKEFTVEKDFKGRGGSYSSDKAHIYIGTKNHTKDEIDNTFLHEVIEAILSERMLRFKLPYIGDSNGDYLFNFNHLEFENWVRDLRLALKDCLK
ncbi:MAG TPA: hypothetical protein ENH85_09835 [Candidatus Scalindua sp.]|nr:hypothetical protein [Candidatus Scalindua sp.]